MFKLRIPQSQDYYHIYIIFLLLFLYGYFQRNNNTHSGVSKFPNIIDYNHQTSLRSPKYDRLVFIVIDALREDFVTNILMPFTFKTATDSECLFKVKVAAPTVTLPRIKTLTTGIVPQYFDMVSNLWVSKSDSSNLSNSFLHSAKNSGKRIVFYGDDTWLHLYPDVFHRSEGTNSMFVNDFYEVDDNVTLNVKLELLKNDWNFMVLHYLGLDHIGHVEGPKSVLIPGKLLEMDSIIELLHRSLLNQTDRNTLIVVTGDHGMRDSGGHGGTSYAETHVPLALLGMPCISSRTAFTNDMYDRDQMILSNLSQLHRGNIHQSDIPTSLALLFGLTIPPNSIGKFIPNFYSGLSLEERFYYCLYNEQILIGSSDQYSFKNLNWTVLSDCETRLIDKTKDLSEDRTGEHFILLISCVFLQIIIVIKTTASLNVSDCLVFNSLDIVVLVVYFLILDKLAFYFSLFLLIVIVIKFGINSMLLPTKFDFTKVYFSTDFTTFIIMFGHSFVLFSSTSYVEEEHQVYYYFFVTAFMFLIYNHMGCKYKHIITDMLILVAFRFVKCLNQTGDQFASQPDLIDWFLKAENNMYSLFFLLSSFILLVFVSKRFFKSNFVVYLAFTTLLSIIYLYKLFYYNVTTFAQILWILIHFLAVVNYFSGIRYCDNMVAFWICISCLVSRLHNLILIPFTVFISSYACKRIGKNNPYQIILHIILSQTMYFCSGFSNSLASVDVASGYIGITSYNPILVPTIVICNTYCLPILSQMLLLRNCDFSVRQVLIGLIIDRMLTVTFVCAAAVIHIQHLFVWSVFAPKILIESCHSIVLWIFLISYELVVFIKKYCTNYC